jgi:hypothetical protein
MIKDVHINNPNFVFEGMEFRQFRAWPIALGRFIGEPRIAESRRLIVAAFWGMLAIATFIIHYLGWQEALVPFVRLALNIWSVEYFRA